MARLSDDYPGKLASDDFCDASSKLFIKLAGVEGFEPPALGFGDRCSTS
jgi:hypothetical protein